MNNCTRHGFSLTDTADNCRKCENEQKYCLLCKRPLDYYRIEDFCERCDTN